METWSNKVQRSFNTFVDDIPDQDLKNFVFAGTGGTQERGSSEYVLKHLQVCASRVLNLFPPRCVSCWSILSCDLTQRCSYLRLKIAGVLLLTQPSTRASASIAGEITLRSAPYLGYRLHSHNMFDQRDKHRSLHKGPRSFFRQVKYPSFSQRPVF